MRTSIMVDFFFLDTFLSTFLIRIMVLTSILSGNSIGI